MIIRVSNKALIFREGRVLLNKCARADGSGFYYDLPGGGQRPGEAAEDGLRREILEETGCRITEIRFCGLFEEINVNPQDQEKYPDYCHRMIHVFTAQYAGQAAEPTEKDFCMLESIWLPLEEVSRLENLLPRDLAALLPEILKGKAVWPGAQFVDGRM